MERCGADNYYAGWQGVLHCKQVARLMMNRGHSHQFIYATNSIIVAIVSQKETSDQ